MHPIFNDIRAATLDAERQAMLGAFLGLGRSVSIGVVERALKDESYAFHLVMSRNNRHTLGRLLGPHEPAASEPPAHAAPQRSTAFLLQKASNSLARWMVSGFATVSDELFEQRFRACEACENLIEAPDSALYRVALTRASDRRVCAACGCAAARKARLATEHCPEPKPGNPTVNRWGEQIEPGRRGA